MKTHDFYFDLPQELIAQTPVEPRDHSRLFLLSRQDGSTGEAHFYDLPDLLQPGDLLFYSNGSGIGHVTIYMGNGQVVHASNSNTGIIISDYGYRTPVSARRYW